MSWYHHAPCLPVIDLSPYEMGDPWRDHVSAQLEWAASEFGSFYVIGHSLDAALIDSVVESSRPFFRMPGARAIRKDDVRVSAGGLTVSGDLAGSSSLSELPELRQSIADYVQGVTGLAHKLMRSLDRASQFGTSYFAGHMAGSPRRELYIQDPSAATEAAVERNAFRAGGLLTLAHQSGDRGLQIEHATGWVDVPHVPGSLVVSVGKNLETLTRGRYRAAVARYVSRAQAPGLLMSFLFGSLAGETLASASRAPAKEAEVAAPGSLRNRSSVDKPSLALA